MSRDEVVLGLFAKLLRSGYCDTLARANNMQRLCVDSTIYNVTDEELRAFDEWTAETGCFEE